MEWKTTWVAPDFSRTLAKEVGKSHPGPGHVLHAPALHAVEIHGARGLGQGPELGIGQVQGRLHQAVQTQGIGFTPVSGPKQVAAGRVEAKRVVVHGAGGEQVVHRGPQARGQQPPDQPGQGGAPGKDQFERRAALEMFLGHAFLLLFRG